MATDTAQPGTGLPLPEAGADECVVLTHFPAHELFGRKASTRAARRTYDATTGIVAEQANDSTPGLTPTGQGDLRWRYDSEGRLLGYGGQQPSRNPGQSAFRWLYTYDDRGNLTLEQLSYSETLDLFAAPSAQPHSQTRYENRYDGERLIESVTSTDPLAVRRQFHEDRAGRCERVDVDYTRDDIVDVTEHRTYDESDRLVRTEVISVPDAPQKVHRLRDYTYDDLGRLVSMEQQGGGHWRALAEGRVDIAQYVTYRDDGITVTEALDYTTDTPNDRVERDGMLRSANHSFVIASAACSALEQQVPKRTSTRCRTGGREENAY